MDCASVESMCVVRVLLFQYCKLWTAVHCEDVYEPFKSVSLRHVRSVWWMLLRLFGRTGGLL